MERGGVFKSNTSQAVRLPKAVALPESVKQVDIVPMGRSRLISPAGNLGIVGFLPKGCRLTSCNPVINRKTKSGKVSSA